MKKNLLFFLITILLTQKTTAQAPIVFSPPGAEWHYNFFNRYPYALTNEEIKYLGDSVVNSENVKIIGHSKSFWSKNLGGYRKTVIKQNGDTVFFRGAITQHSWQILYNYGASVGQNWTTTVVDPTVGVPITYTISVDSIGTVIMNTISLRKLFVNYTPVLPGTTPTYTNYPAEIIERIGCPRFLFYYSPPYYMTDVDFSMGILCYKDDAFGTKLFTDKLCNYEEYMSLEENNQAGGSFHIFPNPGNGQFRLSIPNSLGGSDLEIKVLDLSGRRVKQMKPDAGSLSPSIDLRELETGAYTIQVAQGGQIRYNGKIIKQD